MNFRFTLSKQNSARISSFLLLMAAESLILPWVALAQSPSAPRQSSPALTPSAPPSTTVETDYTLGSGDRFRVVIYKVEEFSGEYLVLVDGNVGFPLIGNVSVAGLTLNQLTTLLKTKYAEYIKRPVISVSMISPRPLTIAIAGEIGIPGSYTISVDQGQKSPTITDMIQKAGGITTTADVSQVKVNRLLLGKQQTLTLDLWQLMRYGDQAQNITLRDGDSIVIPTQKQVNKNEIRQLEDANFGVQAAQEINIAIVGEISRPGTYKVTPERASGANDQTKQQRPRISRAIQVAGGIKPLADIRNISVQRLTRDGETQTINVDLWSLLKKGDLDQDIVLQNGDTITIPTASAINPEEAETLAAASFSPNVIRINVVGEVNKPGSVEVPPNTPLNQAILAAGGFNDRRAEQGSIQLIRLNPNGTVAKRDIAIDLGQSINENNNPLLRNNDVVVVSRNGLTTASDYLGTLLSPLGALTGIFSIYSIFR